MTKYNAQLFCENIALKRGDRELVKHLDFSLNPGEAIALRGENGSGKTTLLRAIATLHQMQFGKIGLKGIEGAQTKDYLMYLGHLDAVKSNERVIDQLLFWADLFEQKREIVLPIINRLGIKRLEKLFGGSLSAGQKKRVAIARLLIANRPLWLLDEPAAPLDDNGRAFLGEIFDEHRKNGGMIITAVHDSPPGGAMKTLRLGPQMGENQWGFES